MAQKSSGARWTGALLYAAAAVGVVYVTLMLSGEEPPSFRQLRETAPLAALLGAGLGFIVATAWPRRPSEGMVSGAVAAVVGLVFFSAVYIFAEAVIGSATGARATEAVSGATNRLGARLPIAGPLSVVAFAAAGAIHWLFGLALGRRA